jgi:hypothetical protein
MVAPVAGLSRSVLDQSAAHRRTIVCVKEMLDRFDAIGQDETFR